jgi:predicted TIM-barrel fold metal-dependent hydrolase
MASHRPSRRELLGGLAAVGLTASLPLVRADDKPPAGKRFDFHHHFFVKGIAKYLRKLPDSVAKLSAVKPEDWTPAASIDAMDKAGISTAFLTMPAGLGDNPADLKDENVALAREANEFAAKLASDHKGRFGRFARLPLPHVDAALKEIEYSLDTLMADGVALLSCYGRQHVGDKAFRPVFDELNRRKAVVHVHPYDPPGTADLLPDVQPMMIEWPTDTSRAIYSVLDDGWRPGKPKGESESLATRCPDVTFIWAHAGGTLVALTWRFLGPEDRAVLTAKAPEKNSKLYHLRRFYYDTALTFDPITMTALKSLVGPTQIVCGTDFPFVPTQVTIDGLSKSGFTADELRGVERENALRVLPKWK